MTQMEVKDFHEKLRAKVNSLHDMYKQDETKKFVRALIMGRAGWGKTALCSTSPKPILFHSFDTDGTETGRVKKLINEGKIQADTRFETDNRSGDFRKNPNIFNLWEKEYLELKDLGAFDYYKTYVIDSITYMADALMHTIMYKDKRKESPEIQHYQMQQLTLVNIIQDLSSLPCHVLVTGHIDKFENSISGGNWVKLLLNGQLSEKIPPLFMENYMIDVKQASTGLTRRVRIHGDGLWNAKSRIGDNAVLDQFEPCDLTSIFKKAGKDWEDGTTIL